MKDLEESITLFEDYAMHRLKWDPNWLEPLRGKDLACFCKPGRCHADILLRLANPTPVTSEVTHETTVTRR